MPGAETWAEAIGAAGALVGIVVALVAVKLAKDSADAAERSAAIADEQLALARDEHAEFMRQLNARARLRLQAVVEHGDEDGVLRIQPCTALQISIEVRIENYGDKAARETALIAAVPCALLPGLGMSGPQWRGAEGDTLAPASSFDADAVVALREGAGRANRIALQLDRVGRSQPLVRHLSFMLSMDDLWDRTFSIRISASADELPEGEPLPFCDVDLRIEEMR